jgi:opacity protein-like surface antigen
MRNGLRASFLMVGLICACNSQAQQTAGAYAGASIGEATNEVDGFKGSDTAFKLTAGYAFNPYFGIELAYMDAGTQTDTVDGAHIENESTGVIASALARLPLGEQFAVFGKLGYAFYDSEATGRRGDLVARDTDSGEDLAYGIGVEFAVLRGLRLRAEYEVVDVSDGDFDVVSAGVVYQF